MQIDFHYNTIRVLTEKAGFSPEDSQIIAYASQYIDDAVDHEKMNVNGHLDMLSNRFTGSTFDPICTAHKGLQFIKAFKEGVQNKIYIPFHFLPELEESDDFRVQKNSNLSKKLVQRAIVELSKSEGESRILNLVRLGIALHTYADSWSHHGFSGRHNPGENDIGKIELFKNGKWERITRLKQFEYNTLPDIGHAEAASYPDQSHLKWKFIRESDNKLYERDNTEIFIDAAENIIELFKGVSLLPDWSVIKTKLTECFSYYSNSVEGKFKKFQEVFPEIGFYYNENQWRNEALNLAEKKKIIPVIEDDEHYILGSDKKWFYFHLAALEQREFVMKLLNEKKKEQLAN